MANNVSTIVAFLQGKGLNQTAIAGILGNLQVESSLSPTAYNPNEGAIGIAQWEGGRRTALQQYAANHGGTETDLNTQLGFLWHELSTSYTNVVGELNSAPNAVTAAHVWQSQYEGSTAASLPQRESYAQGYASSGLTSPGKGVPVSDTQDGPDSEADGTVDGGPTAVAYEDSISDLGSALTSIPALRGLLQQAEANNWTVDEFQNQVENSQWYKTHSDTVRQYIAQRESDPATWQQNLNTEITTVNEQANQLGWSLSTDQASQIAKAALMSGQTGDSTWLAGQIGQFQNYKGLKSTAGLQGGEANTVQQLQQMASDYGFTPSAALLASQAAQIQEGQQTIDTFRQNYITKAKSMYPGLSDQLDGGQTVADIADPYVQSMSNLLEVDPSTLSVRTNLIKQALQGTATNQGQKSTPQVTPLWQFENQVRQDPRWAFTSNANQAMATTVLQLGQTFGFNG